MAPSLQPSADRVHHIYDRLTGFRQWISFELESRCLASREIQDVLANILKIKQDAKKRCAEFIKANTGEEINTHSVYDIQIKTSS